MGHRDNDFAFDRSKVIDRPYRASIIVGGLSR